MAGDNTRRVVLFDGVCNLCSSAVQFIIERDKNSKFKFASLQSEYGQEQLKKHQLLDKNIDSVVLVEEGSAYIKSTAALRIAKKLGGLYPLAYVFIIIPAFIRNWVYDYIARNRYQWYGKKEACWIPTPDLKARFLG